jgi:hypothetical protein
MFHFSHQRCRVGFYRLRDARGAPGDHNGKPNVSQGHKKQPLHFTVRTKYLWELLSTCGDIGVFIVVNIAQSKIK